MRFLFCCWLGGSNGQIGRYALPTLTVTDERYLWPPGIVTDQGEFGPLVGRFSGAVGQEEGVAVRLFAAFSTTANALVIERLAFRVGHRAPVAIGPGEAILFNARFRI